MMRLQIVSDLHLEFCPIEIKNAGADALVLSGDICVANYLTRSLASPYAKMAEQFISFFEQVAKEFPLVLYVLGNHEHYRGTFEDTAIIIRRHLPSNVILLDKEYFDWEDFRFIGGTLWTDFDKNNPIVRMGIENGLNDYALIDTKRRKLKGIDTLQQHYDFKQYISDNIVPNTIVLGHHAPSWHSVTPAYKTGSYAYLNAGYVSDMDEFILDRPNIKLWTHGHVHSSHDYNIGNTRIFANPRGYQRASTLPPENYDFNPNLIVEIERT